MKRWQCQNFFTVFKDNMYIIHLFVNTNKTNSVYHQFGSHISSKIVHHDILSTLIERFFFQVISFLAAVLHKRGTREDIENNMPEFLLRSLKKEPPLSIAKKERRKRYIISAQPKTPEECIKCFTEYYCLPACLGPHAKYPRLKNTDKATVTLLEVDPDIWVNWDTLKQLLLINRATQDYQEFIQLTPKG